MRNRSFFLLPLLLACGQMLAQQTVGIFQNSSTAFDGYTLFGNNETTYLIDNCGRTVNTWESDYDPGLAMHLLPDGSLLRTAKVSGDFSGGGLGGRFERFSWAGDLLWSFHLENSTLHAHHDIEPLPNGHFLAIVWEKHSQSDAQAAGRQFSGEVWSERIVEIEMVGSSQANIVWEWRLWDHLVQDADPSKPNYGTIAQHPGRVDLNYIGAEAETSGDWVHANAIAYHPGLDQIALSSRNFSEIWIINHGTSTAQAAGPAGDLRYRYGNPAAYGRGTAADQVFFQQHDVRWVPEGLPQAGKMMVFNNKNGPGSSSVDQWQPPVDAAGNYALSGNDAYGPAVLDWSYAAPGFYSKNQGGAQPLPNGHVLVCESEEGRFFEITPEMETVWEYVNPVNRNGFPVSQGGTPLFNDVFRASRYPASYPGFAGQDLTPGPAVEINPWPLDCDITGTGERSVFSEKIQILGNPVGDALRVESAFFYQKISLQVIDLQGTIHLTTELSEGVNTLDVSGLPPGIFFVKCWDGEGHVWVGKICKR